MADTLSESHREVGRLMRRAAAGDPEAWRALFDRGREGLGRTLAVRTDRRLQGRVDPSDIIRVVHIEANTRFPNTTAPGIPSRDL
jgi:RNA polymerase sigma-70 factor (ECF subfamily)